jgi:hypothetical protein
MGTDQGSATILRTAMHADAYGYHVALQTEIYRPVVELVRLGIPTLSLARDQSAAQVRLGKL